MLSEPSASGSCPAWIGARAHAELIADGSAEAVVSAFADTPGSSALLAGRYELIAELASGGMATVHLGRILTGARDAGARFCAIKKLHPHLTRDREYIEMFVDEARLAGRIHHPNVVEALAAGRDEHGSPFLVMQYVEGDHLGTLLRHVVQAKRRIAPRVVLRIALDALAGLSAAHALRDDDGVPLGLVHRDISPHNILVGTDGLARLTDFGIAKTEGRLHATRSNVVKGKLAYMSPEQLSGRPLDQRADVFSMGIVIWEALTHHRLFAADDPAEIFRRVLRAPAPPPSSVHRGLRPLDAVLAKALAKSRDERYASAAELARALSDAAPEVGGIASPRAVAQLVAVLSRDKLDVERKHVASVRPPAPVAPAPDAGALDEVGPNDARWRMRTRKLRIKREPAAVAHEHSSPYDAPPASTPSLWGALQLFFSSLVGRRRAG
jgi:serine/threonine protein kinase